MKGFPGVTVAKNLPAQAGDMCSIPRLERSPGKENSNPLQYSCLENPMDRGAWWAAVHGVAKELDTTQWLNNNFTMKYWIAHGIFWILYWKWKTEWLYEYVNRMTVVSIFYPHDGVADGNSNCCPASGWIVLCITSSIDHQPRKRSELKMDSTDCSLLLHHCEIEKSLSWTTINCWWGVGVGGVCL